MRATMDSVMSTVIEKFGNYVYANAETHPERVRRLLLAAYRSFGWYQRHFPDSAKPRSRSYLADACNRMMTDGMSASGQTALVSLFLPCELLQAFDLHPLCAEMFSTFLNGANAEKIFAETAEAAGIAPTFCSYHKILMGASITGVLPPAAFILNASLACDANNLTFREISRKTGVPQYYVDVPYQKDDASVQYVADQLQELAHALADALGRPLAEQKLLQACERSRRTAENMRASLSLRGEKYLAGDLTSELYEAIMMHSGLGTPEALEYSRLLLQDYEQAPAGHGLKIVWMHTNPFWQKAARDLLSFQAGQYITATELSYDAWQQIEETDPYRYMAARLVYDPYNGPISDRIARTAEIARAVHADGIVCFCHWGCKETCGASGLMSRQLEAQGYPTLVLNGDGVDRANASDGQTATRLGAFLEMLKERRS